MYDHFDDRAKKVMNLARQEAQRFNHEYIGTEHILLGLIQAGNFVATNVLKNMGVDLEQIRTDIEKILKSGPSMSLMDELPHTPRAKKVLELSLEESNNLGHNYIGTEHLLLGLIKEKEGIGAQVLLNLGVPLEDAREEVLDFLGAGSSEDDDEDRFDDEPHASEQALLGSNTPVTLLVDPGSATPQEVAELMAELSKLYRMLGGSGITFVHTGTECPEVV